MYVEGNIETRIYNDPNSQQVKRIREIAVRQNGIPESSHACLVPTFYSIMVCITPNGVV